MKKFIKFVMAVAAAAGIVLGALYILREYFGYNEEEDFDEDDFDEVFDDEMDDREYVTIDIEEEDDKDKEEESVRDEEAEEE